MRDLLSPPRPVERVIDVVGRLRAEDHLMGLICGEVEEDKRTWDRRLLRVCS